MDSGAENYRRYLSGDNAAFVAIVRDYKDGLLFYLNGMVHDLSAAEELTEDCFVLLGCRKPHFSQRSAFKTWLFGIGRHLALDFLRKQTKRQTLSLHDCPEPFAEEEWENTYLRQEKKRILHRAVKRLSPAYQQVLYLTYFEDFSGKETAAVLKKSVHATETLLYRARQALKAELLREGFSDENL